MSGENLKTKIHARNLPVWENRKKEYKIPNTFENGIIRTNEITCSKNTKMYLPDINKDFYEKQIRELSKLPILDMDLESMVKLWRDSDYRHGVGMSYKKEQDCFENWKIQNKTAIEKVADSIWFPATEPESPEYGYRSGDLDETKLWEIPVNITEGKIFSHKDDTAHHRIIALLLEIGRAHV